MEMRVQISRLACATALAAVVAACASPDEGVDPAAAESSASSAASSSASTEPRTSVPVPTTQAQTTRPAPTSVPVPKPPPPQPQPKPAPPEPPAPQPPAPPPPNPNPPPGTVSYDLPNVPGSDLSDEDNWRTGYENNCTTAGHPADCLHMSVEVYAPDGTGTDARIDDPGPNYSDDGVYASCPVTDITPMPPATVPVGTTVVIEVHCEPAGGGAD